MDTVSLIRKALQLAGVDTPAFEQLFEATMRMVGAANQAELQQLYAQARARSDSAHDKLQDAGRGN